MSAKEICEDCGKVFLAGKYAFLCPECRKKKQSIGRKKSARRRKKVIEELQEAGQSCNEANDICGAEAIEYAIEIVEKGGVE